MRRRFQFSLRALFLATLIVAVGCVLRGELVFALAILAAAVAPLAWLAWLADAGLDEILVELLWKRLRPRTKRRYGHHRTGQHEPP